jgi:hypothetical protein
MVAIFEQKGERSQKRLLNYAFRMPSDVTVQIVEGQDAGSTLLWNGGTDVVARRGSGVVGMFKKTLSLHDAQATTIRGSSIDELSFGKILAHTQHTPGKLSEARGPAVDGPTDSVTLIPDDPALDGGYTREVMDLSKSTHFPVRILGYQGDILVRKIDFSSVALER